jgi:hypothetical protein
MSTSLCVPGTETVTGDGVMLSLVLSPKQLTLTRLFFFLLFFIKENSNLCEAFRD